MKYKIDPRALAAIFTVFWAVSATAQPNLDPFQPPGWTDKIVVTRTNGGTVDSTALTTSDPLYVDWCVINDGTAATTTNGYVYLYVDGTLKTYFSVPTSFPVDEYSYATGGTISPLTAGIHTVWMDANLSGVLFQTNASDNTYSKIISVSSPNLVPYEPAGWSDKIVVARTTNTDTDSTNLTTADTLYVNWAVINNGAKPTSNAFYTYLYVDGVNVTNWSTPSPLNTNAYTSVTNFSIGSLSAATHTIEIDPNPSGVSGHTNATDNTYTKTITVSVPTLPATTLIDPPNGSITQLTMPEFSWTAVAGATSYRIIVATNAADLPGSLTATTGGPSVVIDTTTANTNYTPSTALSANTAYNWEVHGLNATSYGFWSSTNDFTTSPALSGLTIIPTFASSITSDPQAATIEATINSAIAVYQSDFSTPITVAITFQETNAGLGHSEWSYQTIPYTNYLAALAVNATSGDDATALAHLPNTTGNPVNGNASIAIKYPLARALGFNLNPSPGQPDGIISLNTGIMNLSPAQTNSGKYSLFSTVSHEMDEVLGLGSALDSVNEGTLSATGVVFPEDLFRYDGTGARSYTITSNATSYFSLDGTTDLAQFNQVPSGDFGDWYSYYGGVTPQVQDAFLPPGVSPVLGVELRAEDVIGYSLKSAQMPVFKTVLQTNNTITFTWTAVSGLSYQVQDASNIVQNTWTNLGSSITASNSTASYSESIGTNRQRYYRVELLSGSSPGIVMNKAAVVFGPATKGTNHLGMLPK